MQWSDVIKPPPEKVLRQFAGLFLVVFLSIAGWRWFSGNTGLVTQVMAAAAVLVGVVGLVMPAAVRPIFTGWMIVAFPIGWTVSRVLLGLVFFGLITPLAWVFRLMGRDELRLRRRTTGSHWANKARPADAASYFRQF